MSFATLYYPFYTFMYDAIYIFPFFLPFFLFSISFFAKLSPNSTQLQLKLRLSLALIPLSPATQQPKKGVYFNDKFKRLY